MANTVLTPTIIAKEALVILENELGVINTLHRAHEREFTNTVNGYKIGASVNIRRPADFTVRSGAVMSVQDVIEGYTTLTVDQQVGVDFNFSSTDLTLSIGELGERVMKPALSEMVNNMVSDCMTQMYRGLYHWVGTPGTTLTTYAGFAKAPERMDLVAIPQGDRMAALHPTDFWGLVGSQTALYISDAAKGAYREGKLGNLAGVETMKTQVAPTHTTGSRTGGSPIVNGANQNVTYDTAKNTWTQSLITSGHGTTVTFKAGDVITLASVNMVNPKTKITTGVAQQFVITADATCVAGAATLTISPPIIISGPHQTVNIVPADTAVISYVGSASTAYRQNLVYHKNAMALAIVPMEMPQGAVNPARESYKGISVRVLPIFDGVNDISKWRLDLLYGRKLIDPRLGVRLSGT